MKAAALLELEPATAGPDPHDLESGAQELERVADFLESDALRIRCSVFLNSRALLTVSMADRHRAHLLRERAKALRARALELIDLELESRPLEPDHDADAFVHYTRAGIALEVEGKRIGTYPTLRRAAAALRLWSHRSHYWPEVWICGEHGPTVRPVTTSRWWT